MRSNVTIPVLWPFRFMRRQKRFFLCKAGLVLAATLLCGMALRGVPRPAGSQSAGSGEILRTYSTEPATRQGYLLNLELRDGRPGLLSAAEIDNYMESRHLVAEEDWYLLLLTEKDECIATQRIGNPWHFYPRLSEAQPSPFTVKIPRLPGLASIALYNQYHQLQMRIPLDDRFRSEAAANRSLFLEHDRRNRVLRLREAQSRREAASNPLPWGEGILRPEDMPADLQSGIRSGIAFDAERITQFGHEALDLHRRFGVVLDEDRRMPAPAGLSSSPRAGAPLPGYSAAAHTLSGQVTDVNTGAPIAGAWLRFYQYDEKYAYVGILGPLATDSAGKYSVGVDPGWIVIWPDYAAISAERYINRSESAIQITGDTTWNFTAIPGVILSGKAANRQDVGVRGVSIAAYDKTLKQNFSTVSATDGKYSLPVPRNHPLTISLVPPSPYASPPAQADIVLASDTTRDFKFDIGWVVSGRILGGSGVPVSQANILIRQLGSTGTMSWYRSANSDAAGQFAFVVSKNLLPGSFVLAAYNSSYLPFSTYLPVTKDVNIDIQLSRGKTVSGVVRDSGENTLANVRVRAFQGGNLVNSALSDSAGAYEFDLAPGVYDFEAVPPTNRTFAPVSAKNVLVDENRTLDFSLPQASGILTVKLFFPDRETYSRFEYWDIVRFELFQSGLTAYAIGGLSSASGLDESQGRYFRSYRLYVDSGKYALAAFVAGYQPIRVPDLIVSGTTEYRIDLPAPFLWTGVLRGADQEPLSGNPIQSYSDIAQQYEYSQTDSVGRFSILMTPGGFVKFWASGANNILHTERFDSAAAGRNSDLAFEAFPTFTDSGSVLTQLYGIPDRLKRWNIVMIGDGYTGVAETYTDVNRNGRWDGVLYYDLNRNGVWDTGEPYQVYGNASRPVAGLDPTKANEPFSDLNSDGVPNLHDQELFDLNTLDTARSLFGQDVWRRHRDAFNIFRIRVVSNQAGHRILDKDRNVVIQRDTALGTTLDTPERNYLFSANYTLITQYINQYVPECNTRIVLVNQPIRMGRVNSYMFQYGGEVSSLANDYVVAHEMGHNVGLLGDEYTEFPQTYRGSESVSRNVTSLEDLRTTPWKYLILPGKEIPSVPGSAGVGLFEGAGYYTGGLYRPTTFCMMVSGNRYCPVCTAEIETRLRDITSSVPDAVPRAPISTVSGLFPEFRWDAIQGVSHYLLELEKADGSQLLASYDVYDTSFTLPFALTAGTDFRWRIRPASTASWGSWSAWVNFRPQDQIPSFTGFLAQIAAGGGYQTTLTGINTSQSDADLFVALMRSDGAPFDPIAGTDPLHFSLKPFGIARLTALLTGNAVAGYARLSGSDQVAGTALFRTTRDNQVQSEAGVGLSRATKNFTVYIDNTNNALSGYAVANPGPAPVTVNLTLRDREGNKKDSASLTFQPGQHRAEFSSQRFPSTAGAGFEGSIEFAGDQEVAAVALRFDNVHLDAARQVFSTIPVLAGEAARTLYFPQVADGGGYRTNFILVNPSDAATSARLEFLSASGAPLSLPIGGVSRSSHDLPLNARGVARILTDGTSTGIQVGWLKVTSLDALGGSAIFQTRDSQRILSEAGVASSALTQHFTTFVESLGPAESGLAICNPNAADLTLTLNLRRSTGEVAATTTLVLPAGGQVAKFFTEWFPRGFGEFEGTLEVTATAPVSAVALRYDNPQQNVFATLPVIPLP